MSREITHGFAVHVYDDGTIEVMDLDLWAVYRSSRTTFLESALDAGEEMGERIESALQDNRELVEDRHDTDVSFGHGTHEEIDAAFGKTLRVYPDTTQPPVPGDHGSEEEVP